MRGGDRTQGHGQRATRAINTVEGAATPDPESGASPDNDEAVATAGSAEADVPAARRATDTADAVDEILDGWRRQRPDLDPSPMGIFGRIARLAVISRTALAGWLEDYGLTPADFDVLANLRRAGPTYSKSAGELASSSMMSTGGMTFRIDRLEQDGLVTRLPSPSDRRSVVVKLTDRGLALIDEVIAIHLGREAGLLESFSDAERDQFADLLRRLEREWSNGR